MKAPVKPQKFWTWVDKTDTCWLWLGRKTSAGSRFGQGGYGRYSQGALAHRVAYELAVGPIPDGLTLDHLCGVTACVNPAHLEPVTSLENVRRHRAAQTSCKHGHEFTPGNTYRKPDGARQCRICLRAAAQRYKARKSAA